MKASSYKKVVLTAKNDCLVKRQVIIERKAYGPHRFVVQFFSGWPCEPAIRVFRGNINDYSKVIREFLSE